MRGAFLMCLLALCAALSLHYLQVNARAQRPDASMSAPLVPISQTFSGAFEEEPDETQNATASLLDPAQ